MLRNPSRCNTRQQKREIDNENIQIGNSLELHLDIFATAVNAKDNQPDIERLRLRYCAGVAMGQG